MNNINVYLHVVKGGGKVNNLEVLDVSYVGYKASPELEHS